MTEVIRYRPACHPSSQILTAHLIRRALTGLVTLSMLVSCANQAQGEDIASASDAFDEVLFTMFPGLQSLELGSASLSFSGLRASRDTKLESRFAEAGSMLGISLGGVQGPEDSCPNAWRR